MSPIAFTERAAARTLTIIQEEQRISLLKIWLFIASRGFCYPFAFKMIDLFRKEGDLKLKVFITGGGCHGFKYDFDLATDVEPDDTLIRTYVLGNNKPEVKRKKKTAVVLLVDAISLQYLRGAEIDYQSDLQGERFVIRNLKAKTTCGCGSSFAV
jgi:iron-sulfur cluster insertion protein